MNQEETIKEAVDLLKDVLDYAAGKGRYSFSLITDDEQKAQYFLQAWVELRQQIEDFISKNEVIEVNGIPEAE